MLNKLLFLLLVTIFTLNISSKENITYDKYSDSTNRITEDYIHEDNWDLKNNRTLCLSNALIFFEVNNYDFSIYNVEFDQTLALQLLKKHFNIDSTESGIRKLNFIFDHGQRRVWSNKIKDFNGEVNLQSLVIRDIYEASTLLVLLKNAQFIDDRTYYFYLDSLPASRYMDYWDNFSNYLGSSFLIDNKEIIRPVTLFIAYNFYGTSIFSGESTNNIEFKMNFSQNLLNNMRIITPLEDLSHEANFIKSLERNDADNANRLYKEKEIEDEFIWNGKSYLEHIVTIGHQNSILLLLKLGFDPNKLSLEDKTGFSQLLTKDIDSDLIPYFLKYGADPLKGKISNTYPLAYAIFLGGSFYLEEMLKDVTNLDFEAHESWHFIHFAARYLRYKDFLLVLDKIEDIEIKTRDNYSPKDLAAYNTSYYKDRILDKLSALK